MNDALAILSGAKRNTFTDRTEDELLVDAVDCVLENLEQGLLTQQQSLILSAFVQSVVVAKDHALLRRVIGLPPRKGAPSKAKLIDELQANYEHFTHELGMSDADALRICWQEFHPDKVYETESTKPQGQGTRYDQQIRTIKRLLNGSGYRKPAVRGRKKKMTRPEIG